MTAIGDHIGQASQVRFAEGDAQKYPIHVYYNQHPVFLFVSCMCNVQVVVASILQTLALSNPVLIEASL